MSEPKEPQYFIYTQGNPYGFRPDSNVSNKDDYLALFDFAGNAKIVGEASAHYICAPHVADELYAFNPRAKIMAILRNPVERAYSGYLFWYQYAKFAPISPEDFRDKFFNGSFNSTAVPGKGDYQPMEFLRSFGFYHRLLQPYYAAFPRSQILVSSYDQLKADPAGFLRRVLAFLEVDDSTATPISTANVTVEPRLKALDFWLNLDTGNHMRRLAKRMLGSSEIAHAVRATVNRLNRRKVPAAEFVSDKLFREMIEVYQTDIIELSKLVGMDFTPWLQRAPIVPSRNEQILHDPA